MNSANAASAPPPASSSRLGAAPACVLAWSIPSNGALSVKLLALDNNAAWAFWIRSRSEASCQLCSPLVGSCASQLWER